MTSVKQRVSSAPSLVARLRLTSGKRLRLVLVAAQRTSQSREMKMSRSDVLDVDRVIGVEFQRVFRLELGVQHCCGGRMSSSVTIFPRKDSL